VIPEKGPQNGCGVVCGGVNRKINKLSLFKKKMKFAG